MDPDHGTQARPLGDDVIFGNVDTAECGLTFDGGSFRDRTARVFLRRGEIFRTLTNEAAEHWRGVRHTAFFQKLSSQGQIVGTRELTAEESTEVAPSEEVVVVLSHDRIPFVSYPFEWTFSMLREAALLHLKILSEAIQGGFILKDASAYNVQFKGARSVFIDIGSFVSQRSGEPWTGYRQFCEMMLFPLLLQSYRQIDIQPILRSHLNGISAKQFLRSMSWRDMLRPGVFTHGWLQSALERQAATATSDTVSELKSSGFSNQLIVNNLAGLTKLVKGLKWKPEQTLWTDYRHSLPHVVDDLKAKSEFVQSVCQHRRRKLVWDLGCNDGYFSRIASSNADTVVAMDQDHGCVERLFNELAKRGPTNILPLCMDLLNPSPAMGWRGRERGRLEQRGLPDLTICLGLIHHLVIGGNIPLPEVADWLASLGGEVILEFPSKQDEMVRQLLRNKQDQYEDYSLSGLEVAIQGRFDIGNRMNLPSGQRTLLHLLPRSTSKVPHEQ